MLNKDRVLEILRETGVLLEGHFLLTSGRHSNQYMQCAKILQYPNYAEEIAKGLAEEFKEDAIDIVVGPAMGGIIIAYELARQLNAKNLFAERENGKMVLRRGFSIPKGARVLVAEDVVTTGGSVFEVIDIVKEQGGEVAGVAVLVDRSNGSVDFGAKLRAALTADIISYEAEECPLCKEGKLPLVKPGSRNINAK
ncbi:orotate phosphoribosyltransferase [Defluviitalea raffinosedens]|uniref:orotate phosphoribosyltransferase n=1 Tax=Defluviitalea raffinosedens TaxID=1450156 RepID=UPI00176E3628|nr:orotate phosphoribosyltransferase [Defluviitalea raffinosedens]MBM7685377.1 orotate phosphoribosyltransferase [Defluviitalea raffinosedens]HHW66302.1 orotate phosphoribosyltransferase [Candidatus Epulonipiscium sp.]